MGNRSLARGLQDGLHDPRPPHLLPIIHLCFRIFVSKEIPGQEIGNQSFRQSLPLEVNVCPLHIVSTAALSLPPRTRSGALANTLHQATNGESFSICNFCLDFSRSFCSRQNHRGRCEIKAGDDAKVEGSCCNDERAELAIVAALLLHLQSLHRPFLHNLNGYKHISVCAGLVRLHILKTGPLHRRPNETSSWCTSSSKVAQLIFTLHVFDAGDAKKREK